MIECRIFSVSVQSRFCFWLHQYFVKVEAMRCSCQNPDVYRVRKIFQNQNFFNEHFSMTYPHNVTAIFVNLQTFVRMISSTMRDVRSHLIQSYYNFVKRTNRMFNLDCFNNQHWQFGAQLQFIGFRVVLRVLSTGKQWHVAKSTTQRRRDALASSCRIFVCIRP